MMGLTKAFRRLAAGMSVAVIMAALPIGSATAAADDFSVLDHNTQGNASGRGLYSGTYNYLIGRYEGALGVSHQEMCYSVWRDLLVPYMDALGHKTRGFYTQHDSATHCPEGYFGVGVSLKGTTISRLAPVRYSQSIQYYRDPDNKGRGFRCVEAGYIYLDYVLCSTHLANGPISSQSDQNLQRFSAYLQAGELKNYLAFFPNSGTMIGGDFNLNPQDIPSVYYSDFWETDQANRFAWWPYRTTTSGSQHYDFVWAKKSYFGMGSTGTIGNYFGSDHRLIRAFFNW